MNREIKFRAYDKLQNKFLYPYPNGFNILGEVTCFDLIGQQLKEFTPHLTTLERLNDVEIMQFTGLKDDEGTEIWEGDIIEYTQHHFNTEWTKIKRKEVKWIRDRWNIYATNAGESDIKVIGNIFENKELLEQQ